MARNYLTQTEHSGNLLDMKDKIYNLVDTADNTVIHYGSTLNQYEVSTMNYAFALNGSTKRYIWERDMIYTPSK
jgi:hypothetical protein